MENLQVTQHVIDAMGTDQVTAKEIVEILEAQGVSIGKKRVNATLYKMLDLGLVVQDSNYKPPKYTINKIKYDV